MGVAATCLMGLPRPFTVHLNCVLLASPIVDIHTVEFFPVLLPPRNQKQPSSASCCVLYLPLRSVRRDLSLCHMDKNTHQNLGCLIIYGTALGIEHTLLPWICATVYGTITPLINFLHIKTIFLSISSESQMRLLLLLQQLHTSLPLCKTYGFHMS